MGYYRFYLLSPDGRVTGAASVEFPDAERAVQCAREQLDRFAGVEVWDDSRRLAVVSRAPRPAAEGPSLGELDLLS